VARTNGDVVVVNLQNLTLTVRFSKVLTFRLRVFRWLMCLACWVGSVGVEFVESEQPGTAAE